AGQESDGGRAAAARSVSRTAKVTSGNACITTLPLHRNSIGGGAMSVVRLSSVAAVAVLVTVSLARPRPCAAQMQYTGAACNVTLKMTVHAGLAKIKGVFAFTVRGLASGWAGDASFQGLAWRLDAVAVMLAGGDDLDAGRY